MISDLKNPSSDSKDKPSGSIKYRQDKLASRKARNYLQRYDEIIDGHLEGLLVLIRRYSIYQARLCREKIHLRTQNAFLFSQILR